MLVQLRRFVSKHLSNSALVRSCLAASYDAFLASSTVIKNIPKILGPGLNKAGKFPSPLSHDENMAAKVAEIRSTVRFQMKKYVEYFESLSTSMS
jgi:large subunit ribosomal protein L10Ae